MFTQGELSVKLPISYELDTAPGATRGVLVLHGFSDHARAAKKRLLGTESVEGSTVFAPNGLFPSPVKDGEGFKEAYSWYFRDPASGKVMISPDTAAAALVDLIAQLGLANLDWTVLGFSQGGFFAPHLVRAGLRSRTVVAAGAAFRPEAYEGLPPFQVHAIHGEEDPVVPIDKSRASYEAIRKMGYGAAFHALDGVKHTIDSRGRAIIREVLEGAAGPAEGGPLRRRFQ